MEPIGTSKAFLLAAAKARALSKTTEPFLAIGPGGSGRTYLAEFIHKRSNREAEPFVVIDLATVKDIGASLYGETRSNILGVENTCPGALDEAGGGTIVIKNIHLVPIDMQPQLMATIRFGGFKPKGSDETLKALCRFGATLSVDPKKLVDEKRLLPEFAQMFAGNTFSLPALREREEDVETLANHFIKKWCALLGLPQKTPTKQAMKLIKKYRWPGNVAELQTMTLSAVLNFGGKEIDAPHLQMRMDGNWRPHTEEHLEELALEDIVERKLKQFMVRLERYDAENLHAAIMERVERPLIKLVMERSKNNQLKASRILGINRNTLRTKLKKLDIER